MAVFRVERTGDYTVMSNHHLRRCKPVVKSQGAAFQMLSLPDDWNYTPWTCYISQKGEDAIALCCQ